MTAEGFANLYFNLMRILVVVFLGTMIYAFSLPSKEPSLTAQLVTMGKQAYSKVCSEKYISNPFYKEKK